MYDTQVAGISKGYINIAKNTGIATDTARKIKGHLEQLGIVKTDGNRTIILDLKVN